MSNELDEWAKRNGIVTVNPPVKMSRKQAICWHAASMSALGVLTLKDAVKLIGSDYYYNAEKHVGTLLGNMVRRGMLTRVRPGVFAAVKAKGQP